MQGLIVDDVNDHPIVSLDEFIESINKEPPFEDYLWFMSSALLRWIRQTQI